MSSGKRPRTPLMLRRASFLPTHSTRVIAARLAACLLGLSLAAGYGDDEASTPVLPDAGEAGDIAFAAAPMRVKVGALTISHPEFALFVMPGEALGIAPEPAGMSYRVEHEEGRLSRPPIVSEQNDHAWTWIAPERPGLYPLTVTRADDGQQIRLNVFVMVPATQIEDGRLNGYRIGAYPEKPLDGRSIYRKPRGFIELTADLQHVRLSPHFRLGEFASRQDGGYPKYLVMDERLLLALEELIVAIRNDGLRADSLHVMSGYRTPYYNKAIGNVEYSLHQWGMAADVFIDENPVDQVMDDLDGDGEITRGDAERLYRIADSLQTHERYRAYVGGTGLYGPAFPRRGPFIHIDVRGWRARW